MAGFIHASRLPRRCLVQRPVQAGSHISALSRKSADQKRRESTPYFVGNPRQASNLAVVSFASGADFDTFVADPVAIAFSNVQRISDSGHSRRINDALEARAACSRTAHRISVDRSRSPSLPGI
jgi:hypothetical protein